MIEMDKIIKGVQPEDQFVIEKIFQEKQEHVFRWWAELSASEKQALLTQLRHIDFDLINGLKNQHIHQRRSTGYRGKMTPVDVIPVPESPEEKKAASLAKHVGEETIRSGKLGILMVAGGQGTRLGFHRAKGSFPISPVKKKSLFQIHAEKILAASQFYGVSLPWYIMTSEMNGEQIKDYFYQRDFFGLDEKEVVFFEQGMLPALDDEGKFFLNSKAHIFTSPNGHGGVIQALLEKDIIGDMEKRGVEIISYFQVDNVLIKMVDPFFVGYHVQARTEMSAKMVRKRNPREKVGHFVQIGGKVSVIEYSEMSEKDKTARNAEGGLKFEAGSIGIHLINLTFLKRFMKNELSLPYHVAKKKVPYLDEKGHLIKPQKPNGYKFEKFIFDAFEYASNPVIVEVAREDEFSPVKNKTGENSPETAQKDLSNLFGRWLERAGISVPKDEEGNVAGWIEISSLYAFNEDQFLNKVDPGLCFQDVLYLGPQ